MPLKTIRVREIMTQRPVTSSPGESLRNVATLMRENHCGFIPLVSDGRLAGVVTDRDIAIRCVSRGGDPSAMLASDIMTTAVQTVDADDPIDRAMMLMEQRQLRRIPVLQDGQLIGVVSQADLVANLAPHRGAEMVKKISRATWRLSFISG